MSSAEAGRDGRDPAAALAWIAERLEAEAVPWQLTGGLAARAYGSRRPLADIDIWIPAASVERVLPHCAPFGLEGPTRVRDGLWDVTYYRLVHSGQAIELGLADGARYRDRMAGLWRLVEVEFTDVVRRDVLGVSVPLVPKAALADGNPA